MSKNRLFRGTPTLRLVVSVEADTVERINLLIGYPFGSHHPARGNRGRVRAPGCRARIGSLQEQ